jgi:hypothetical protein
MRFTAVVGDAVHHGELPGIFQTINDRGDPQRPWAGAALPLPSSSSLTHLIRYPPSRRRRGPFRARPYHPQ